MKHDPCLPTTSFTLRTFGWAHSIKFTGWWLQVTLTLLFYMIFIDALTEETIVVVKSFKLQTLLVKRQGCPKPVLVELRNEPITSQKTRLNESVDIVSVSNLVHQLFVKNISVMLKWKTSSVSLSHLFKTVAAASVSR